MKKKESKIKKAVNKETRKSQKRKVPDLDQWLNQFIEEHDDVLRELAKR